MSGSFVNRLTVTREQVRSRKTGIINVLSYTGDDLYKRDLRKFIEVVYRNFEEIADVEELNHNRKEIARLLTSPQSIILIAILEGKIIGYLIAEVTEFNLRRLMHIYYLYTAPIHRGNGIATYLLNLIQKHSQKLNIDSLSLTYDTYNKNLTKFYYENGFNIDFELKSNKRHDMLVKNI